MSANLQPLADIMNSSHLEDAHKAFFTSQQINKAQIRHETALV